MTEGRLASVHFTRRHKSRRNNAPPKVMYNNNSSLPSTLPKWTNTGACSQTQQVTTTKTPQNYLQKYLRSRGYFFSRHVIKVMQNYHLYLKTINESPNYMPECLFK